MPCRDDRDEPGWQRGYDSGSHERERLRAQLNERDAMLCAALTALERLERFGAINYAEAGVTKGRMLEWWTEHKRRDEARRERERKELEFQRAKQAAAAKLTPAERKLLGVNSLGHKI